MMLLTKMVALWGVALIGAAGSPVLPVEIGPEHPLFIFEAPGADSADGLARAEGVLRAWDTLSDALRPYSVLEVRTEGPDFASRLEELRILLARLSEDRVPLVVQIADGRPGHFYPLEALDQLLKEHTAVKGLHVQGLAFNTYYEFGEQDPLGMPPEVRWLAGAIETAARHGRFIAVELGELHWPRVMSNAWCRALYATIRENRAYVLPLNGQRGPHNIARMSALMGLWLEDAVENWGIASTSEWYAAARFIQPGLFGISEDGARMPPSLYRAMILNGAMTGATVYRFDEAPDLWAGTRRHYWDEAIAPTLAEIVDKGFVVRKDLVRRKTRVAYQLAPSATSMDFHKNLADIDAVFDRGALLHGAYGMEWPGQIPELILNSGRFYWIPLLSPYASEETLGSFDEVMGPGLVAGADGWTRLLESYYTPDGQGTAFISRVGRGVFVMHTRENAYEEQNFRLPSMPAPVRGLKAERRENGILLSWPFREDDFAYRIHRRILPRTKFSPLTSAIDERRYLDSTVSPADTVAYAVTSLTKEQEPYEGTLNFGDYRVFSTVESRIVEEVLAGPLTDEATAQVIVQLADRRPRNQVLWPNLAGLADDELPAAKEIAGRIEAWGKAFEAEDLSAVLDLYTKDYEDAEGRQFQVVEAAYQWFFNRYGACKMDRQIRRWEFDARAAFNEISVLVYCRFSGVALTDAAGRIADIPAYFPRATAGEVWLTFTDREGPWRIAHTNPPLPSFDDILSFSAPPAANPQP